jgi:hypothetical protein
MALTIKIKRATRAQLNSAASANQLVQGEPYLITDEDRIAVGFSASTYQTYAKDSEVGGGGGIGEVYYEKFTTVEDQDTFELDNEPSIAFVWVEGLLQDLDAYSIDGKNIVFVVPPDEGDSVKVYYATGDGGGGTYSLPLASTVRGGIKAVTKGEGDTVEVKIDTDSEKLYVATYPTVPTPDVVFAGAPNSSHDVNSTNDVLLIEKSLTGLAVGDQVCIEIKFAINNNSGANRQYTCTSELGGFSNVFLDATNVATSATNTSVGIHRCVFAISATDYTTYWGEFLRGAPAAAGTVGAGASYRYMDNNTSSNLTGSKAIKMYVKSNATAGTSQTFILKSWTITVIKAKT